jgi:hypothetical protein
MKIVLSSSLLVIGIFLIPSVYGGQEEDKSTADFILEVDQSNSNPVVTSLIINDPSNQSCKAECKFVPSNIRFYGPDIPNRNELSIMMDLDIQDSAHYNLTAKKKALVERWSLNVNCSVKDIIEEEENGKEKYICEGLNNMYNNILADGPVYEIKGVYSLPDQKLSINGTFTDL